MISFILKILGIFLAFHFYKNRYPKEFNEYSNNIYEYLKNNEQLKPTLPYLLKAGYAVIYVYSFCQIVLNKVIQTSAPCVRSIRDKVCEYLVKNNIISEKVMNNIHIKPSITTDNIQSIISFFNDGELLNKQEFSIDFKKLVEQDLNQDRNTYDLLAITSKNKNNNENNNQNFVHNILTFTNNQIPTFNRSYELSNIRFIAFYLKQLDKSHPIDLCKDNTNYYVVGNVINSAFMKYYLKNVLNVTIDNNIPFKYTLELMDHNVKMVYLDETNSIIIQKDDYIVDSIIKTVELDEEPEESNGEPEESNEEPEESNEEPDESIDTNIDKKTE